MSWRVQHRLPLRWRSRGRRDDRCPFSPRYHGFIAYPDAVYPQDPWERGDCREDYDGGYTSDFPNRQAASRYTDVYGDHSGYSPRDRSQPEQYGGQLPVRRQRDEGPRSDWNPRRAARTDEAINFDVAIKELYRQVEQAEKFFKDFHEGFNKEVEKIKKYATAGMVKELWFAKVRGQSDPAALNDQAGGNEFLDMMGKFDRVKEKTIRALATAARSTRVPRNDPEDQIRQESDERLQGKLCTAHEQTAALLNSAHKDAKDCNALVRELTWLKDLLKPKLENRESNGGSLHEENGNLRGEGGDQHSGGGQGEGGGGGGGAGSGGWT